MSTVKHDCCASTFSGTYGLHHSLCSNNAKYERDGKWYCGTHDPVAIKARDDARNEKWRIERAENKAQANEKDATEKLQAHKAACFDELLAALQSLLDDTGEDRIRSKNWDKARAAVAKAIGGAS
jgi:uncharacterized Zn finger protein (UPF0148 family)